MQNIQYFLLLLFLFILNDRSYGQGLPDTIQFRNYQKIYTLHPDLTLQHEEYTLQKYIDSTSNRSPVAFLLFKNGKEVLRITEYAALFLKLHSFSPKEEEPVYFKDINQDGYVELVFDYYTGGASCCQTLLIYSLGSIPRSIFSPFGIDGCSIEDIDGDGSMEVKAGSQCLKYWYAPGVFYEWGELIFSYQDGYYSIDKELMQKPEPNWDEVKNKALKVREEMDSLWKNNREWVEKHLNGVDPLWEELQQEGLGNTVLKQKWDFLSYDGLATQGCFWFQMRDWVYSGNIATAKKFLDQAWSKKLQKYKKTFWLDFLKAIGECEHNPFPVKLIKNKP